MNRIPFGPLPPGADSPELYQPEPILTLVSRMKVAGRWVTALVRSWRYDDTRHCGLCRPGKCTAIGGQCVFLVGRYVPDDEAPLYRIGPAEPSP